MTKSKHNNEKYIKKTLLIGGTCVVSCCHFIEKKDTFKGSCDNETRKLHDGAIAVQNACL